MSEIDAQDHIYCPFCGKETRVQDLGRIGLSPEKLAKLEEHIQNGTLGDILTIADTILQRLNPTSTSIELSTVKTREAYQERSSKKFDEITKLIWTLNEHVTGRPKGDVAEMIVAEQLAQHFTDDEFDRTKADKAGTDIVAAIMQKKFGIKPGTAIMIIDFFVISVAGLLIEFKDLAGERSAMTLTLYAFFLLFVSSRFVDAIIDGFDYARTAYIISDKPEKIAEAIMHELSRGATALKGRGLYKNIEREIIVTVVTLKELGKLIHLIKDIDPDAFVTVHNVHEVLGEGFRKRI